MIYFGRRNFLYALLGEEKEMASPYHPALSVEEYFELDASSEDRYEYIDGMALRIPA